MDLSYESVVSLKRQLKKDFIEDQLQHQYEHHIFHSNQSFEYPNRPDLSSQDSTDSIRIHNGDPNSQNVLTQGNLISKSLNNKNNNNIHLNSKRWKVNSRYFNNVFISKLSGQQILKHAISGGDNEIMGMLIGTTVGSNFIVTQTFPLPILGTETRVNAQSESYEYMVQYMNEMIIAGDKLGNIVGWYHSHPGYDCWLSAIDMRTQDLNQSFQDPYLAIVVDPKKTLEENAIQIGAFRTVKESPSNDDNLNFYELPMTIFNSDFNKCLNEANLRHELPTNNPQYESLLFDKLFDSMKQLNNFNDILLEEESIDQDSKVIKSEFNDSSNKLDTLRHKTGNHTLKKSKSNSAMSVNSGNNDNDNDSDIDMIHDNYSERDAESESVNSSVYDLPDSNFSLLRSSFHGLHSSEALRGIIHSNIENSDSGNERSTNNTIKNHSIEDLTLNLQKNNLHQSYVNSKRELLRFKLQEYKNLRFYRDAFTI